MAKFNILSQANNINIPTICTTLEQVNFDISNLLGLKTNFEVSKGSRNRSSTLFDLHIYCIPITLFDTATLTFYEFQLFL